MRMLDIRPLMGTVAVTLIRPRSVSRRVLETHRWERRLNTGNSPIHWSSPPTRLLHEAVFVRIIPGKHQHSIIQSNMVTWSMSVILKDDLDGQIYQIRHLETDRN